MATNLKTPIIGIDRGASFTDFAIVESGRLKETFSLENRSWKAISSTYARLSAKYQTDHIVFSGCATGMPDAMREHLQKFVVDGIIASWSVPDEYAFVEVLPKTSVGKIDKKVLRSRYQTQ